MAKTTQKTKKTDSAKAQKSEVLVKPRLLSGVVVSNKMNKTIVVAITRLLEHPKYGKRFKSTVKFKVHDENNSAKEGDKVMIKEVRPMSKEKRWSLA